MSLIDKLVQNGLSMGKNSSDFTVAAQKNADATWFYTILGGILLYFFNWLWSLLPFFLALYSAIQSIIATLIAGNIKTLEPNENNYINIVQAYGKAVEESQIGLGIVADVNELPFSKEQIKKSILLAIKNTDDVKKKEQLKTGYLFLADWQENVGETHQGFDPRNYDTEMTTEELLHQMPDPDLMNFWLGKVTKEQDLLMDELSKIDFQGERKNA